MTAADAFCEAFPATFLAFHRRDMVTEAMDALDADTQRGLLDGLEALLAAATPPNERNGR
ncbi:MAG: hypothetical protein ACOH1Y_13250 [Propionicimonas sp.]